MHGKLLLVGTISNVASSIEKELKVVLKALSVFKDVEVFLVESDSVDTTIKVLGNMRNANVNFNFVTEGKLSKIIPNRIERIAFCRNIYVDYIRKHYQKQKWDYVAVADLDGMNLKLSKKGIESCFKSKFSWDGITANQKFGYYDLYALRAKGWVEQDCFEELEKSKRIVFIQKAKYGKVVNFLRQFYFYDSLRKKYIYNKMIKLRKKDGLVRVESAFGGFAIYKPKVFLYADYKLDSKIHSEHVFFNLKIIRQGGEIYINPRLVNSWFNVYNLNKFLVVRFIREARKFLRNWNTS
jgi:hypothetical protein